jgi:hypothetical protein
MYCIHVDVCGEGFFLFKTQRDSIQERERKNLIEWKCHNGLLSSFLYTVHIYIYVVRGEIEREGGFAPWLAAALADDDGSAGFWFFSGGSWAG